MLSAPEFAHALASVAASAQGRREMAEAEVCQAETERVAQPHSISVVPGPHFISQFPKPDSLLYDETPMVSMPALKLWMQMKRGGS